MTLPYAGTSGWSGSETSQTRALTEDANGTTERREKVTLRALREAGAQGLTYQDLGRLFGWHHGASSGVLSRLHKTDQICRLSVQWRRNRCAVYVLEGYVVGRDVDPHGRANPVADALSDWLNLDFRGQSKADQDPHAFVQAMRTVTGFGM